MGRLYPGDVTRFEDRREGLDRPEFVVDGSQVLFLQQPRVDCGLVGVVGEGVPAAEYEPVQALQRREVLCLRDPVLGALAQTDRAQLG